MTADPYQASAGPTDPGSWNRYAYVQGDPVNYFDPQGKYAIAVGTVALEDSPDANDSGDEGPSPGFCTLNPFDPICMPDESQRITRPNCAIKVRARRVAPAANVAQHAYVEVRNERGEVQYLEGGPEKDNPIVYKRVPIFIGPFVWYWVDVIESINWGLLIERSYSHGSEDETLLEDFGESTYKTVSLVSLAYRAYIPRRQYNPGGPNSNSFVNYLLEAAGINSVPWLSSRLVGYTTPVF